MAMTALVTMLSERSNSVQTIAPKVATSAAASA
jgi:hypothetical protein